MNRIATIKALIVVANALEERGMAEEAWALDQITRRMASIESEGGLQGDYPISPNLINGLGEYDPYSLNDFHEQNNQEKYEQEEFPNNGKNEATNLANQEIRTLAQKWSFGTSSELYNLAQTGNIDSIDQRRELLEEINQAIISNNDAEEHAKLYALKQHVIDSVPILTQNGTEMVTAVNQKTKKDASGGENFYLMFQTDRKTNGLVHSYLDKDQQFNIISAGLLIDGEYHPWNWGKLQTGEFAAALYDKHLNSIVRSANGELDSLLEDA